MKEKSKTDELISVSMQIIMHAGNARNLADEAFNSAKKTNFKQAAEQLKKATEQLVKAHNAQTNIIQSEAKGIKYDYSPLFAHAQDTLMTISSEINCDQKMIEILKLISI